MYLLCFQSLKNVLVYQIKIFFNFKTQLYELLKSASCGIWTHGVIMMSQMFHHCVT